MSDKHFEFPDIAENQAPRSPLRLAALHGKGLTAYCDYLSDQQRPFSSEENREKTIEMDLEVAIEAYQQILSESDSLYFDSLKFTMPVNLETLLTAAGKIKPPKRVLRIPANSRQEYNWIITPSDTGAWSFISGGSSATPAIRFTGGGPYRIKLLLKPTFLDMLPIPAGTFLMGCDSLTREFRCFEDEKPAHRVSLSAYQIGKYEVTQADWRDIMGSNPSFHKDCDDCPVENVSWSDVQDFLKKLNARYPGKNYRLPTEAEWEYAARGGAKSGGYSFAGSNNLSTIAWYRVNSGDKTHPVGNKLPNELGLFDMSGNVWEWCSDRYGNYRADLQTNPRGSTQGQSRVGRGGAWDVYFAGAREQTGDIGFREREPVS